MIEVYYRPTCPFCVKAMDLLKSKRLEFKGYNITENPDLRDEMIERAHGAFTVPQIFINDVSVGGCNEIHMLNRSGELDRMLARKK